jgi:hypothetical protein
VTVSPLGCDGQIYFYTVALKVTDTAGLSTTQEVRLDPDCQVLAPLLKYLSRDEFGAIRWQLTGDAGRIYRIEGSTNLVDWIPVTSITTTAEPSEFDDPSAANFGLRFYRAVLAP